MSTDKVQQEEFIPFPERGYVSHSSIQLFLSCEEAWANRYLYGIDDPASSRGRDEGTAWSTVLEHGPTTRLDPQGQVCYDAGHPLYKALESFTNTYTKEYLDNLVDICNVYIEVYRELYKEGEETQREVEFILPISSTLDAKGYLDALDSFGIIEDKFLLGNFIYKDIPKYMTVSSQQTMYLWAAREMGWPRSLSHRITVKPTINRRLVQNPETRDQYRERLEGVLRADTAKYFRSYDVERTDQQLDNWHELMTNVIRRMHVVAAEQKPIPNHGHCTQYGGCVWMDRCGRKGM
jgi:hypothetical protein